MILRVCLIVLMFAVLTGAGCQSVPGKQGPLAAASPPASADPVRDRDNFAAQRANAQRNPETSSDLAGLSQIPEPRSCSAVESADVVGLDEGFSDHQWISHHTLQTVFAEPDPIFCLRELSDAQDSTPEPSEVDEEKVFDAAIPEVCEQPRYVVDLPTVLRLAGSENWGVRLAYERIHEAQAKLNAAEVMWLPSLNLGVGYTKHDGQLQATNGQIVDVSRNSLFVGGGAVTSNAPTAGGSGGPARLFVDLSLADAIFKPLAARQDVSAAFSSHRKVFNNTQLEASLAYYDLVGAQGLLAIAVENLTDARRLEEMTQGFVAAGRASDAEIKRVQVVAANRRQDVISAELAVELASAELARIIRLDPMEFGVCSLLQSVETHVVPVEFIPCDAPLHALIAQGRGVRAEVAEEFARVQSQGWQVQQERWRPWIPNLHIGASAGGFGGGIGSDQDGLEGRSDLDALLVWQARNLGLGARAARREQESRYRQAVLRSRQVQDIIAAEVKGAWSEVDAGRQQIDITRETLEIADDVYESNIARIRGLEGLPIEAIQALDAVAQSRRNHLTAVIRYNRGQLKLLRAIGQPLEGY